MGPAPTREVLMGVDGILVYAALATRTGAPAKRGVLPSASSCPSPMGSFEREGSRGVDVCKKADSSDEDRTVVDAVTNLADHR